MLASPATTVAGGTGRFVPDRRFFNSDNHKITTALFPGEKDFAGEKKKDFAG